MKSSLLVLVLLSSIVFSKSAHGQIAKGTVADRSTRIGLNEAEVVNLSTKERGARFLTAGLCIRYAFTQQPKAGNEISSGPAASTQHC